MCVRRPYSEMKVRGTRDIDRREAVIGWRTKRELLEMALKTMSSSTQLITINNDERK